ncbi:MAG: GNAT family N-acetyltransferase [Aphanothece sp. CMT-3BRIN-NPC111]|jgi:ribosomal-protein-alanine N-acetyltransferase|nr:GNAT family N-acetyltransferase [Aphanothece sp. CMT-3BRIN-NPC111]
MNLIDTARMRLRPLAKSDLDSLARIYSDPDVMKYRLYSQPASFEQTQESLQSYLAHWERYGFGRWAVVHKPNQQFIGHCGLENLPILGEVELNYLLAKEYWGRGLTTEAARSLIKYGFETLKLQGLVALAKPENLASLRIMQKIGMQYERVVQLYGVEWVMYAIERHKCIEH